MVEEDLVRDHLSKVDTHRFMACTEGMHFLLSAKNNYFQKAQGNFYGQITWQIQRQQLISCIQLLSCVFSCQFEVYISSAGKKTGEIIPVLCYTEEKSVFA